MTKNEFTQNVANLFNERNRIALFTPTIVEQILGCAADVIVDALKTDGKITIKNLL